MLKDKHYARGDPGYERMLDALKEDECGLCTLRVHPKPILKRFGWWRWQWIITERHEVPEGVEHYWLLMPRRHLSDYDKMTWIDHWMKNRLIRWAQRQYGFDGYGITGRSGASRRTGSTLPKHVHLHLIIPKIDPTTGRAIPYYFPIG